MLNKEWRLSRRSFLKLASGSAAFASLAPFPKGLLQENRYPITTNKDSLGFWGFSFLRWLESLGFQSEIPKPEWLYLGLRTEKKPGLNSLPVQAIHEAPDGKGFLVATYNGGLQEVFLSDNQLELGELEIPPDKLNLRYIHTMVKDKEGDVWLGGQGSEVGGRGVVKITSDGKVEFFQEAIPTIGTLVYRDGVVYAAPLLEKSLFIYNKKRSRWSVSSPNERLVWLTEMASLADGRIAVPGVLSVEIYHPAEDSWQTCQVLRSDGSDLMGARAIGVINEGVLVEIDPIPGMRKIKGGVVVLNDSLESLVGEVLAPGTPPPGPRCVKIAGYEDKVWTATRGPNPGEVYGVTEVDIEKTAWGESDLNGEQVQAIDVNSAGVFVGSWTGIYFQPF